MAITVQRTPEDQFKNLPDFDYAPNYIDTLPGYEQLRVHYVDEGPENADKVFLCLHGQPSWSFLYRKMIPVFLETGARVIAPDWLGFGRSDKPVEDSVYTYHFHRNMMMAFIQELNLQNITLVCQDWGGILGLSLPQDMPERFKRLIVMNTAIPVGASPGAGFDAWKAFAATQPDMDVAALMQRGTVHPSMEGVETSQKAANWWSTQWAGESFMAVGMADPVLGGAVMEQLRATIKGCPAPMLVEEGGHFLQEWGEPVARAALKAFGDLA